MYGKNVINIKAAKLSLIHSIWMSKFDLEASTDELIHASHLFTETMGTETNYFGANCELELGNNFLKQKKTQEATAFLAHGL